VWYERDSDDAADEVVLATHGPRIAMTAPNPEPIPSETAPAPLGQRRCGVYRQLRALCAMSPRQIATLLTRAYADWSSDGAARLGAALAYFTLFSVAPVLIVVTGVAGLFIGHAAAQGQIAPWLDRFLSGEGAKAAELMLKQAATPAGGIVTTVAGVITLFLGTSALVAELRQSMNIVWRVLPPSSEGNGVIASVRSLLSDRLYAFLLVIGAGLLVLTSLIVNTTVTVAATYFDGWLPIPAMVLQILNVVVSFGLMTTVFTLVYKMVPDAQVSWGDASVGALITASLFIVGTMAVSAFVGTAGGSSMYGSAASVLALLVWVYYSAQVFFFGAEITRIFATEYGAGIIPHHRSVVGLWHRK
jgi:membrane protein